MASRYVELSVCRRIPDYVGALEPACSLQSPFIVSLALVGVQGVGLAASPKHQLFMRGLTQPTFDRPIVALPELMIDTTDRSSWDARLEPLMVELWHASGLERVR